MSTQELIAIIGYVKEENKIQFFKELNLRIPKMTEQEKIEYEQNLQELKQNEK
jgi:hydrogenase-4 membrane subunit HyfE